MIKNKLHDQDSTSNENEMKVTEVKVKNTKMKITKMIGLRKQTTNHIN